MDSAEDSGHLTDQLIAELAANAISAKNAKSLAQRFMELTAVRVSNMEFDAYKDAEDFTRKIFRTWRNQSKEQNKVKVKLFSVPFCVPVILRLVGQLVHLSTLTFIKSSCQPYFTNCCCFSTGPGPYSVRRTWTC